MIKIERQGLPLFRFLNPDSKFMHYAFKFSDLVILNLWVVFTSIPIITIGTATSSMHYVLLKIYRDEPLVSISKCYCQAFRDNFKKSTILWIIYILVSLLIGFDLYLLRQNILSLPAFVTYALYTIAVFLFFSVNWGFILQSRYENHIHKTVGYAFLFSLFHFWDTILMGVILCIPYLFAFLIPKSVPLVCFCGFTSAGIIQTSFYNRVFTKHECLMDSFSQKNPL